MTFPLFKKRYTDLLAAFLPQRTSRWCGKGGADGGRTSCLSFCVPVRGEIIECSESRAFIQRP